MYKYGLHPISRSREKGFGVVPEKTRKFSFHKITEECEISKSSAHRICSNEFGSGHETRIPSAKKQGRPRNVSKRNMRLLIHTLKSFRQNNVHVIVRSLGEESGLSFQVATRRTYS